MTAKRYGMAHSTIKYWQDVALDLRRMRGHYAITAYAAQVLYRVRRSSGQDLGHSVIGLAAIASPDYVRFVLQHGRFPLVRG